MSSHKRLKGAGGSAGLLTLGLALAGALAPTGAQAHLVNTRLGDFYGGALHPLTDFAQMLPWLALAGFAALQGPRKARWIVPAFPLALLAGGVASQIWPSAAFADPLGVVLIAVSGLALAAAVSVPLPALLALTVVMGLLHGYQNGAAMAPTTDRLLFLSGVMVVGYVVLTLLVGGAIAFLRGASWRTIALRAGGSWVAAVGVMLLGLSFVAPRVL